MFSKIVIRGQYAVKDSNMESFFCWNEIVTIKKQRVVLRSLWPLKSWLKQGLKFRICIVSTNEIHFSIVIKSFERNSPEQNLHAEMTTCPAVSSVLKNQS